MKEQLLAVVAELEKRKLHGLAGELRVLAENSLSRVDRILLSVLLDEASTEFANHGCNDLVGTQIGLTLAECDAVHAQIAASGLHGDYSREGSYFEDWILMSHYATKLYTETEE